MKTPLMILSFLCCCISAITQCDFTVSSTNGYTVDITFCPTSVIAPAECEFGYFYNLEYTYDIVFSGDNIPSNLWTLQAVTTCDDGSSSFFSLPNDGGSGSGATISNQWNPNTDCATATPTSLGCTTIDFQIHGPGITNQIITCDASNCSETVLPIQLSYFNAELNHNEVALEWETQMEINNDFFSVEESSDAIHWYTLTKISGNGDSFLPVHYSFIDKDLKDGTNYYRLSQTDFNGTKRVYTVQAIEYRKKTKLAIVPNPVRDFISIKNNQDIIGHTFNILNKTGQRIQTGRISDKSIAIDHFPAGLYFMQIEAEEGSIIHRFIKE